MTATLHGFGISATLPRGFEGRISRLKPVDPLSTAAHRRAPAVGTETTQPFLHIANVPLPAQRDTFGGGVVEMLKPEHVFIALIEYGPECVGTNLFKEHGLPRSLSARSFSRRRLQRIVPGQSGSQSFFTDHSRAFCLYIVAGSHGRVGSMVHQVNRILRSISIDARVPT